MINLNDCVKEQKLRLYDGKIVSYVSREKSRSYPHEVITEDGDCLSYTNEGIYHTGGHRSDLNVVEILPLETMINLNTCVKGQKLRLRKGRIVTYVYNDRSSTFPHKTRTEEGHYLSYPCDGIFHGESGLDVVEILPLDTTDSPKPDTHPSIAWWESCPWITDRMPTEEDGNGGGLILAKLTEDSNLMTAHWETIQTDRPWVHCQDWRPVLTAREQALQLLDDHRDGWRPTPEQWHVIRKGLEAS